MDQQLRFDSFSVFFCESLILMSHFIFCVCAVGMMNQKYFILFLWHTFWLCIFSGVSLVSRFISCTSKPGFPRIYAPGVRCSVFFQHAQVVIDSFFCLQCDWDTLSTVMAIMNFIEALLFGLFTGIMMFDQFGAIFENTTYIDSLKGQRGVQVHNSFVCVLLSVPISDMFGCVYVTAW
jgi:hypothetical protein